MASESQPLNPLSDSQTALAKLFNNFFNVSYFTSTGDILVNMHNVVSNIVWYRIMSWFYLGISIASICIGALYIHLCTVEHMIPLYLIVAGSVGVTTNLIFMCKWATQSWASWNQCGTTNEGCKSFWFSWTLWILFWFNFAWFIAGSVWIFGVHTQYRHNYDYEPETHLYVVSDMHSSHYISHHGNYAKAIVVAGGRDSNALPDAAVKEGAGVDEGDKQAVAKSEQDIADDQVRSEHVISSDRDNDQAFGAGDGEAILARSAAVESRVGVDFAAHRNRLSAHSIRKHGGLPNRPFCHRALYGYAFWVTIVQYILLFLDILVLISLTCCTCCAFLVVQYPTQTATSTELK